MTCSACCTTQSRSSRCFSLSLQSLALLLTVAFAPASMKGQGVSASSQLLTATDMSSLESVYQRPWHMKVQIDVPDKNKQPGPVGTIERWQDAGKSRTVYLVGNTKLTELNVDDKQYRVQEGDPIPDAVRDAFLAILHPGPSVQALNGTLPELHKQTIGKVTLDCIMLARTLPAGQVAPLGLFPTYCLTDDGQIAASYNLGSWTISTSNQERFLDHSVAMNVSVRQSSALLARAKVVELKAYTPEPGEFDPTPELVASAKSVRLSGAVVAGRKTHSIAPIYPDSARSAHVSGTVLLSVTIGEDGLIEYLVPLSTPTVDFAIAAMTAVRQWQYKPYLLNGQPVRVNTTVTVNFNLR